MPDLKDKFGRSMKSLRLSVTDRCNLRCTYCMPAEGVEWLPHAEVLSLEELNRALRVLAGLGLTHIKITGGEPLLRKGLEDVIAAVASVENIEEISMTTNGMGLKGRAPALAKAGLQRVTVSIDSLDPQVFREVTRGGDLKQVLDGLMEAERSGLVPIKINCVVMEDNDKSLLSLAAMTLTKPWEVRFIEYMPMTGPLFQKVKGGVSQGVLRDRLEGQFGPLSPVVSEASAPARSFRFEGAPGKIGFISSVSEKFCAQCDRLRLSADGFLRLCMAHQDGLDLKGLLRKGLDDGAIAARIQAAVWEKPEGHDFEKGKSADAFMSRVGG